MSKSNFWQNLRDGFTVLAPMEDVTDSVFRRIVISCGRPDVLFTEFTSCEGICSPGRDKVAHRLLYTKEEHPIVAQIWGITPQNYYDTTKILVEMGFDGVDINMGCPVDKIIKQGACSALIKNPTLAAEIITATKEAAGDRMAVSVKTRIGFNEIDTENWCGFILKQKPDALTVHGRTVKELSKVPAHWDEIAKVVELRNIIYPETKVIGNGDILTLEDVKQKVQECKVDGVMIGRGIFHNPWVFNESIKVEDISTEMKISKMIEHLTLWQEVWKDTKNMDILKKYFKIYINGFDGAAALRDDLMKLHEIDEILEVVKSYKLS